MGRKKSWHLQMTLLHKTNAENVIIAGGRSSVHSLLSVDTLGYNEIVGMAALAEPLGGLPASVGTDGMGNDIFATCVIPTVAACQSLKQDPVYQLNLQQAAQKSANNRLFSGGLEMVDGHVIKKYNPVDPADAGPIGSPLQPKAVLGVAITAGTGALTITGGGNATDGARTDLDYFECFPKFAYRFRVDDVLSLTANFWDLNSSDNFYVVIINSSATSVAAADRGKWCIYEISANSGYGLTVAKRLGPANYHSGTDTQWTVVGGVTWDSALHSQNHDASAMIYLASDDGLPLACTPMLLRQAVRRGYGMHRNERMQDTAEGGFIKYAYILSIFGQNVRSRKDGRVPGVVLLKHTVPLEGLNIPTVS